ncbi:hypothetical protein [Subtercola boreus]|nr:hypothetical protein [Subtercola boreus]
MGDIIQGYVNMGREYKAPWCCVRCRTPYMCADGACDCHINHGQKRPYVGWRDWADVIGAQPSLNRQAHLQSPREWQTRWFVNNLIRINPVTGDLLA